MNKYEVIETIGEGAYGIVLKCRNRETNDLVAIKRFKESEDDELVKKTSLREVKVLRLLREETFVVHLIEAFKRKGKLYLVFEYVGCNLLEYLEKFPNGLDPEEVRRMVFTLLLAIRSCHHNDIIHRDIKPENLLVRPADHTLRLCDFGFARAYAEGANDLTDYVATRWYRSPELLLGTTNYGLPSDLWAVGCIMAELIDGQALFPGETELDQIYLIQKLLGSFTPTQIEVFRNNKRFAGHDIAENITIETSLERKFGQRISRKGVSLLKSLLSVDPTFRPTADQALVHPYFEGLATLYCPQLALPAIETLPGNARPATADRRHQPAVDRPMRPAHHEHLPTTEGSQSVAPTTRNGVFPSSTPQPPAVPVSPLTVPSQAPPLAPQPQPQAMASQEVLGSARQQVQARAQAVFAPPQPAPRRAAAPQPVQQPAPQSVQQPLAQGQGIRALRVGSGHHRVFGSDMSEGMRGGSNVAPAPLPGGNARLNDVDITQLGNIPFEHQTQLVVQPTQATHAPQQPAPSTHNNSHAQPVVPTRTSTRELRGSNLPRIQQGSYVVSSFGLGASRGALAPVQLHHGSQNPGAFAGSSNAPTSSQENAPYPYTLRGSNAFSRQRRT